MLSYVIPTFNSGNKIQILPLNYNPTTCLNLSTAADVYSVVRHIVRRESSTLDILGLYQQAYGSPPINQLTNCSPQTNYFCSCDIDTGFFCICIFLTIALTVSRTVALTIVTVCLYNMFFFSLDCCVKLLRVNNFAYHNFVLYK